MTEVLFTSAVTALSCLLPAKTDIVWVICIFFRSIVGAHFVVVIL